MFIIKMNNNRCDYYVVSCRHLSYFTVFVYSTICHHHHHHHHRQVNIFLYDNQHADD